MQKFLHFFRVQNLLFSLQRFPVASIFVLISTLILLFLTWENPDLSPKVSEYIARFFLATPLIFFLSIGMHLSSEAGKWKRFFGVFSQILVVIFGIVFVFSIENISFTSVLLYISILISAASFLFFAPHMRRFFSPADSNKLYYSYFLDIFFACIASVFFGGLLFLLGLIAVSSVFFLFALSFDTLFEKIISTWAILSILFLAPIFGMHRLPRRDDFYTLSEYRQQAWHFIVEYLFLPFTVVYFLILYAYSFSLVTGFIEWPKGFVSWLVIIFSILGYFTYILSYALESHRRLVCGFRKIFPIAVIPMIGMLFYTIYLRIAQFDLTINRYLVVLFGLWLLIISLYLSISKRKFLAFIPFFLTVIILVFSVGPWSLYELPATQQFTRLEATLKQANILQNGKIVPLKNSDTLRRDVESELRSQLEYLCDMHACHGLEKYFPKIIDELIRKNTENQFFMNSWQAKEAIFKKIGLENYYITRVSEDQYPKYLAMSNEESSVDIQKYDSMYRRSGTYLKQEDTFYVDANTQKLSFFDADGQEKTIDITPIFRDIVSLLKKHEKDANSFQNIEEKLFFEIEDSGVYYGIYAQYIRFEKETASDDWKVRSFEADTLFIGKK